MKRNYVWVVEELNDDKEWLPIDFYVTQKDALLDARSRNQWCKSHGRPWRYRVRKYVVEGAR